MSSKFKKLCLSCERITEKKIKNKIANLILTNRYNRIDYL